MSILQPSLPFMHQHGVGKAASQHGASYRSGSSGVSEHDKWFQAVLRLRTSLLQGLEASALQAYTEASTSLSKVSYWQDSHVFLADLSTRGLSTDLVICNIWITAWSHSGNWAKALTIFDSTVKKFHRKGRQSPKQTATYNAMISTCGRALIAQQAFNLCSCMKLASVQRNIVTYTATMGALTGITWALATSIFEGLHSSTLQANMMTYTTAVSVARAGRQWMQAVRLCAEFAALLLLPSLITVNSVLNVLATGGKWHEASKLLALAQGVVLQPDLLSFNCLVSGYQSVAAWTQAALTVLEVMQRLGTRHDEVSLSAAVSVCEKSHRWDMAVRLQDLMHLGALRPNIVAHNAIASALASGIKWGSGLAMASFNALQQRNLRLDATTLSAVISAAGLALEWEQVSTSLRNFALRGPTVAFDTVAFNGAISNLGKASAWRHSLEMYRAMKQLGIPVSILTSNSVLDAYSCAMQWSQALRFVEEARKEDLLPDVVTYSTAVVGAAVGAPQTAIEQMLAEMRSEGVESNTVMCIAAVETLDVSRDFPRSPALCADLARSVRALLARDGVSADGLGAHPHAAMEGLSAAAAATDLLASHGQLRSVDECSFRRRALLLALVVLKPLRDSPLESISVALQQLPNLGDASATDELLQRLELRGRPAWCPTAQLVSRCVFHAVVTSGHHFVQDSSEASSQRAGTLLPRVPKSPAAKVLAAWAGAALHRGAGTRQGEMVKGGSSYHVRGRVAAYTSSASQKVLIPVLAEHDRSGHAERTALLALLQQLRCGP
eukprot:TRINITY_DN74672_c0_g1_i1.p1 TRINITY_DN74672_c0_g1~~TRINITY_DN74672_c0_g1_i1.p1  ORF type:complete len:782 (-),score=86.61 TRINITY_DN74672_c0_g1_i1:40-2385(-)